MGSVPAPPGSCELSTLPAAIGRQQPVVTVSGLSFGATCYAELVAIFGHLRREVASRYIFLAND